MKISKLEKEKLAEQTKSYDGHFIIKELGEYIKKNSTE